MKNLFIIVLFLFGASQIIAQKTISIEANGNLESPKPLLCVHLSQVTNENNPADILNGMRECIKLKDFKNAVRLFAIAGVYGKFDTYRVINKSAHQALLVLQQSIIMNLEESERNSLFESLNKELEQGSDSLNEICQAINKIGFPKYFPKYMIQHGIQAFTGKEGNGLNEKFDSQKSWNLALKEYLHCEE